MRFLKKQASIERLLHAASLRFGSVNVEIIAQFLS